MTFKQIKQHILAQTNNDLDDLADVLPHMEEYINEGYDLLMEAWDEKHVGAGGDVPRLDKDMDIPDIPEWTHGAIADWATWLMYRNGNPQKQQRGMQYKVAFLELVARIRAAGGKRGKRDTLVNVYAPKFYANADRKSGEETGQPAGEFDPFEVK